jgi:hypothetical protein
MNSSSGPTTVGPETTRMAPIITAACHDRPSSPPNTAPKTRVTGTPITISRVTTRRVWPRSCLTSSIMPES